MTPFGHRFVGLPLVAFAFIVATSSVKAADFGEEASRNAWAQLEEVPASRVAEEAWVRPEKFHALLLDRQQIMDVLRLAPLESNVGDAKNSDFVMSIPMPDGSFARFRVVESPIMAPELAAQFPTFHTYLGQGVDDPTATIRFDLTPQGFHSQILSPTHGASYIDPYTRGDDTLYTSYYKRDLTRRDEFHCIGPDEVAAAAMELQQELGSPLRSTGATRKEYAIACAATGEYTTFHGGTVALGQAAIVTAINRVTGVYETELAIRLILVANNSLLVYTNGATDPYDNANGSTMLGQNVTNCNAVIGSANYDIGHVFSTGGGGIAGLSVVCGASKARGVTGLSSPIGDGFYIDYVAHEMGHQFGGNHCFNGASSNCVGNRVASTAYEPGSGSTIMAYAGVCSALDNIQNNSDPYFHFISIQEMSAFINAGGNGCATAVNTGNGQPTVNAGVDYTIPSGTPFILTAASGSDPDGDAVTYCWEERDLGAAQTPGVVGGGAPDLGSGPLFRSFSPVTSLSRTCPRLSAVLANTLSLKIERVPTTNRTMNWRCTIRDNRAGNGGANSDDMNVIVTNAGGAFSVTSPNTNVSWSGAQTVTWAVAGTSGAPVNTANVNILLSTDAGNTFPTTLLASTPNDGSQVVTLPNINTTQARIKVEAVGNIFFDTSNLNFTITPAAPANPNSPQVSASPVCPNDLVNLSATVGANETIDWYTGSCGGALVGSGNPLGVNPLVTTTYLGQARNTISGLLSPGCSPVTVIVYQPGDANGNGAVDLNDIDPYVNLLLGNLALPACAGDYDLDGDVDGDDLVMFTDALEP
ncbi:MAG: zinc-dependent metalloprotease family protein [Planctomycetota bacterium]